MILITGATGNVGSELVKALKAQGVPFRALAHSAASAEALAAQGIAAVVGDLGQPQQLGAALSDVERLFLLSSAPLLQSQAEIGVIDAARRAGVRAVVKLSVLAANSQSPDLFYRLHGQAEAHLKASGLGYTLLQPNNFMQNFPRFDAPTVIRDGAIYTAVGEARISFIDTRDIADVAAAALTSDDHAGKAYVLTGGAALSYAEVAEKLSALLGRTIQAIGVSGEAAREGMLGAGVPPWYADGLIELYASYRRGEGAVVTDTVARLLGRAPRSLDAYFAETIAAFRAAQ
jgi:uncharacterized protein YbjT (DUF2867 family)